MRTTGYLRFDAAQAAYSSVVGGWVASSAPNPWSTKEPQLSMWSWQPANRPGIDPPTYRLSCLGGASQVPLRVVPDPSSLARWLARNCAGARWRPP